MNAIAAFASNWLPYIKFIHIVSVFLWGFTVPPAYSVYVKRALADASAQPNNKEVEGRLAWAWDRLDYLVAVEHIAWPIILITGPLLLLGSGWAIATPWLEIKLFIVVFVMIPIEAYDTWMSHAYGAVADHNRTNDPKGLQQMRNDQARFYAFISPIVRISMVVIYFVAIVKPMSFWP